MISLVLMTILASAAPAATAPLQVFAGPTFESLANKTDRICPRARIRFIKPAGLDWQEGTFEQGLSASDRAEFNRAIARAPDGDPKICEGRNGLSCSASWNLEAIERAHQMRRFVSFICVTKAPNGADLSP